MIVTMEPDTVDEYASRHKIPGVVVKRDMKPDTDGSIGHAVLPIRAPSTNESPPPETTDYKVEFEALKVEADAVKEKLKKVREEYCLRDLNGVLEQHKCQIMASPDGRFAVHAMG